MDHIIYLAIEFLLNGRKYLPCFISTSGDGEIDDIIKPRNEL